MRLLAAQVVCKCKPSLFAYPKPVTAESSKVVVKVNKAVLSTTVRAKKREATRRRRRRRRMAAALLPKPSGMLQRRQHHDMPQRHLLPVRMFRSTALGRRDWHFRLPEPLPAGSE